MLYDAADILSVESVKIDIRALYMMIGLILVTQTDVYERSNALLTLCLVTFMLPSGRFKMFEGQGLK